MRTIGIAVLLLCVSAAHSDSAPTPLGAKDARVLGTIARLDHNKQLAVFEELKVDVPESFHNCVCKAAGYGSTQTWQGYHPQATSPGKSPSCDKAGLPCMVSGYGCLRYPMPSSSSIYQGCNAKMLKSGEAGPMDAVLDAVITRQSKTLLEARSQDERFAQRYAQCRRDWRRERSRLNDAWEFDGLAYLRDQKKPLLPPPGNIRKDLEQKAEQIRHQHLAARKKAAAEVDKAASDYLAEKLYTNKRLYEGIAQTAMADIDVKITAAENRRDALLSDRKGYDAMDRGGANPRRSAVGNQIEIQTRKNAAEIAKLKREKASMQRVMKEIRLASDVYAFQQGFQKLLSKKGSDKTDGAIKITEVLQGHFNDYVDSLAADPSATSSVIEDAAEAKKSLGRYINHAKRIARAQKLYEKAIKTIQDAEKRAASGKYSEAERNLIAGFEHIANTADTLSDVMPSGAKEVIDMYAEAMRTPGAVHKLMTEAVDRADVLPDIQGGQARGRGMQQASERAKSLVRDDYLFRAAGLSVYREEVGAGDIDGGKVTHVAIPELNGEPIYLNARQYKRLQAFAYWWPIANGEAMSDTDVRGHFGKLGKGGLPPLDRLRQKAEKNLKSAAWDKRIAEMYGKKTVSREEVRKYREFGNLVSKHLPEGCALDAKTRKSLFNAWREDPAAESGVRSVWRSLMGAPAPNKGKAAVQEFLAQYGKKMHAGEREAEVAAAAKSQHQ